MVRHYPALNRPSQPVCSVCIANYNGVGMLADCLDSVFAQQCDFDFEVIVHDDASTDDSVSFLRERYPQIELLASEENVGFCIGNNRMAEIARGQFLLLLNNDAALLPDALAQLRTSGSVDDRERILTLPQLDWLTGELVDRGCLLDPFYNPVPNLEPERTDVAMVIGACLWLPLRLWQELGGFPEWIGSIGEDMYLCCHARLRGHAVESIPASGYRHRQGSSFGGGRVDAGTLDSTFRRRRLSERNKTLVLAIFTPTFWAWPLLFLHLLTLAGEGLILGLVKMDRRIALGIYGHAIASPWRERARIRQLRASAQSQRAVGARDYFKVFVAYPRKLAMLVRFGIPHIRH